MDTQMETARRSFRFALSEFVSVLDNERWNGGEGVNPSSGEVRFIERTGWIV